MKIKMWNSHIPPIDENTLQQVKNLSTLDFVSPYIAVMPDAHLGKGACIGTVIPTIKAIIPAAVGVDIGCGMLAFETNLKGSDLPDNLHSLRLQLEEIIPHGRTDNGGINDKGAWSEPTDLALLNIDFLNSLLPLVDKYPKLKRHHDRCIKHLGTLGTGNHFVEMCIDENQKIWIMLHSGSRGIGNAIGTQFILTAQEYMAQKGILLPDKDLAYLEEQEEAFVDYMIGVEWAQQFARLNRTIMMHSIINILLKNFPSISIKNMAINCHHNYVERLSDYYLTRKGAIDASLDKMGIIPGSMGTKSYIVRGLGNPDSFHSCSHGAGRIMSRGEAKRKITLEEHLKAVEGVECRQDADVIDESPGAYKNIDAVMESQKDLIEIVHTLKQILCIKG